MQPEAYGGALATYPDDSPSRTAAATAVVPATANGGTARVGEAVEEPKANIEAVMERLDDA